jgi:hypothetical protein
VADPKKKSAQVSNEKHRSTRKKKQKLEVELGSKEWIDQRIEKALSKLHKAAAITKKPTELGTETSSNRSTEVIGMCTMCQRPYLIICLYFAIIYMCLDFSLSF